LRQQSQLQHQTISHENAGHLEVVNFDEEMSSYKEAFPSTKMLRKLPDGSSSAVILDSKKVQQIQSVMSEHIKVSSKT
jgi:hypothetical protein